MAILSCPWFDLRDQCMAGRLPRVVLGCKGAPYSRNNRRSIVVLLLSCGRMLYMLVIILVVAGGGLYRVY